jgi:excisionase family DNA binding protein
MTAKQLAASASLTTDELAELLHVSRWTLYAAVRDGDPPFPFVRVGSRAIRWPRATVYAALGLDALPDDADVEDGQA